MTGSLGDGGWERLFWLVFERTSNPVALLDEERRILSVNDAAVELLGSTREQIVHASILDSVKPSERAEAERNWEEFLRSGEYSGTRDLVRADGSEILIEFAARLAHVGDRRIAIYVALAGGANSYARLAAIVSELDLTNREREVVTLIALGHETPQIAEELHISPETVRTHVRNAMAKLGAHTRAQLVAVVLTSERAVHGDHVEAAAAAG
jgi:PAS domain S-box-containing protein